MTEENRVEGETEWVQRPPLGIPTDKVHFVQRTAAEQGWDAIEQLQREVDALKWMAAMDAQCARCQPQAATGEHAAEEYGAEHPDEPATALHDAAAWRALYENEHRERVALRERCEELEKEGHATGREEQAEVDIEERTALRARCKRAEGAWERLAEVERWRTRLATGISQTGSLEVFQRRLGEALDRLVPGDTEGPRVAPGLPKDCCKSTAGKWRNGGELLRDARAALLAAGMEEKP